MEYPLSDVTNVTSITLAVTFLLIIFQEAVNGFHDVANAIATVIYSRAMTPRKSRALSAAWSKMTRNILRLS
jgi:phosphate/sulfate permease